MQRPGAIVPDLWDTRIRSCALISPPDERDSCNRWCGINHSSLARRLGGNERGPARSSRARSALSVMPLMDKP